MEGEFHIEAICFFQIVTVLTCLVSHERKRVRWTRKILSSRPKLGKRTQGFFHTEIINHRVLHNMTAEWLEKTWLFVLPKFGGLRGHRVDWRPQKFGKFFKLEIPYLLTDFSRNKQKKALVQPGQKLFPMPPLFVTVVNDICTIKTFEKLLNIVLSEVYS